MYIVSYKRCICPCLYSEIPDLELMKSIDQVNWAYISDQIGNKRSSYDCKAHFNGILSPLVKSYRSAPFSAEEDAIIKEVRRDSQQCGSLTLHII